MNFVSFQYAVFLTLVVVAYFRIPHQWRWALLLVASCIFYMFFIPAYILVLFALILTDYVAARLIDKAEGKKRLIYLQLSFAANLGILCFFKYYNFFVANVATVLQHFGWHYDPTLISVALPLGLSFHTFQSLSYTIEVYWKKQKPEKHLGRYALYVLFFPQLVAGPIERPQNLLPQFKKKHVFKAKLAFSGLRLILIGLIKKVVIADRLAVYVNSIYADPHGHTGLPLLLATYFFGIQIFCDFSGYTDMARGSARILGFELMQNFEQPYLSKSISEFWRRWHISLTTWFRDYLYTPLVFSRWGGEKWIALKMHASLLVVFLVSGLWHGANWTFVIWGGLHGTYLVLSPLFAPLRQRLARWTGVERLPRLMAAIQMLWVFNLAAVAWIFFRARNLSDAFYIVSHILPVDRLQEIHLGISSEELAFSLGLVAGLLLLQYAGRFKDLEKLIVKQPTWLRWGLYAAGLILFGIFGTFNGPQFIYFDF